MINAPKCEATNSIEDINKLYIENERLVSFFIKKNVAPIGMSIDEYESELMISLWKSARTYDSNVAKFSTYAIKGMFMTRGRLIQESRRKRKLDSIEGANIPKAKFIDMDTKIYREELTSFISELTETLPTAQRDVITCVAGGESRIDIAKRVGKQTNTISECCREAVRNIKKRIKEEGIECPI